MQRMGVVLKTATEAQMESALVEAMNKDLPLAVKHLHRMSHGNLETGGYVRGNEDPNSELGKQLIRICASTILRELAEKHFCHGQTISFVNCCGPIVGPKKPTPLELMKLQIAMQDGTIAHADC